MSLLSTSFLRNFSLAVGGLRAPVSRFLWRALYKYMEWMNEWISMKQAFAQTLIDNIQTSHKTLIENCLNFYDDVWLAFDPNCSLSTNSSNNRLMENDYIQLHCYVRLIGHLVPVMIWRREGQLITGAETKTTKAPVGNQITVRSSLLLQVSLMDNEVTFSCDTHFTPNPHNISSDGFLIIAKNIPDYKYIWTSPPINVSCKSNSNVKKNNCNPQETCASKCHEYSFHRNKRKYTSKQLYQAY